MECEVAREALSARVDNEREPVPSARVNEHLTGCAECRSWFEQVSAQAVLLQRLARPPVIAVAPQAKEYIRNRRPRHVDWARVALLVVGAAQILIAAAQAFGLSVGLAHQHGMASAGHLLNESTAWSMALGIVMVGAAAWPGAAAGLGGVLSAFSGVLTIYVIADAASGAVTAVRVVTHLPVVLGAVLALLVWRRSNRPGPEDQPAAEDNEITLPRNASRGRRRGHLWPTDGSAA
ncbi:zf-HC2 domain-containing protein [Mycolicibacterium sp. Y3]